MERGEGALRKTDYFQLLKEFIRFGCFTFGGGWSIVAQMQQLYVEKKKVITSQELMDLTSVAKTLPGTMIANVAMLYGYRMGGLAGGLVCVFGMTVPPMLIMILICFGYQSFRDNYWVVAAMAGMQAAVVPIIASAAGSLIKGSLKYPPCVLVTAVCFLMYSMLEVNILVLILFGVVSGFVMGGYYERKGALKA